MSQFHRLDPQADAAFLRRGVADPLTGVAFRPTNAVVRCATCGLISLRETWEAVGGCPNGHTTAGPWDGGGDGAVGAPPRPRTAASRPAPEPPRRRWLVPVLLVLGVATVAITALVLTGQMQEEEPVEVVEEGPTEPTGPSAITVQAGDVDGSLGGSDFRGADGRYQDLYTFAADSSGRVLTFVVTSEDFLPDLVVETPDGQRVEAEAVASPVGTDGEVDETRRVTVQNVRGPGLYRLFVSSRRPAAEGDYTLTVRQEDPVRTLSAGGTPFDADLGQFSQQVDGFFRDTYRFRAEGGREHTVIVRSSAFAPTVVVTAPGGGAVEGESGRAGGSVTYTFAPSASGTYSLVVSSREREKTGRYSVTLAVAAPEPTGPAEASGLQANEAPLRDSVAVGQQKAYPVRGRIGDRVLVEVRADGFTPTLTLVGPDGSRVPAEPDGDRARVRLTLPSDGVYRVVIGAQGQGAGDYSVSLEQRAAVTADEIPRLPGMPSQPAPPPQDDGGGQPYRPQPIGGDGRP